MNHRFFQDAKLDGFRKVVVLLTNLFLAGLVSHLLTNSFLQCFLAF